MEREFKGVWIPKEIWLNKDLTLIEKHFLAEINSLDNQQGCFASNAHFSEMFDLAKNRCTQVIKSLEKKEFVSVDHEKVGNRISKRIIKVLTYAKNGDTPMQKMVTPYAKNGDNPMQKMVTPYAKNGEGINTLNNTKERDSALAFLESNSPSRLESFMMQNKKQIADYEKFVLDFEAVVTLESIPFESDKLFARLGQYARNWIKNNSKFRVIKNEDESVRMANRHLHAAI